MARISLFYGSTTGKKVAFFGLGVQQLKKEFRM